MSLFQSNLRKQIRNLPKILNFVKKIHYYSELFTSLLNSEAFSCARGSSSTTRSAGCSWLRSLPRRWPAVPFISSAYFHLFIINIGFVSDFGMHVQTDLASCEPVATALGVFDRRNLEPTILSLSAHLSSKRKGYLWLEWSSRQISNCEPSTARYSDSSALKPRTDQWPYSATRVGDCDWLSGLP